MIRVQRFSGSVIKDTSTYLHCILDNGRKIKIRKSNVTADIKIGERIDNLKLVSCYYTCWKKPIPEKIIFYEAINDELLRKKEIAHFHEQFYKKLNSGKIDRKAIVNLQNLDAYRELSEIKATLVYLLKDGISKISEIIWR